MSIAYVCAMCIVHSARDMYVHYATHHQMQCTIELRTLNFISVPNFVSLAQNFLEPEDPTRIKFSGPGARTLHPTRTATGKAYRLGEYTCDLQVWDRWCTSPCLQRRQKKKRYKTLARAQCTCTVHSSPLNRTAPSTLCQGLPTYRVWCLWLKISLHRRTPRQKSFPILARTACTLQERQPQKHTCCGCIRVTCKFGVGGASRLACRVG